MFIKSTNPFIHVELSNTYSNVQDIIPVTKAPQNSGIMLPRTGIVDNPGMEFNCCDTTVPTMTLAPVDTIFATAKSLSPQGRLSGLKIRILNILQAKEILLKQSLL